MPALRGPARLSGKSMTVEQEVAELKAEAWCLKNTGMKMHNNIAGAGGAKTAWFKDSEGNILAVSHRI